MGMSQLFSKASTTAQPGTELGHCGMMIPRINAILHETYLSSQQANLCEHWQIIYLIFRESNVADNWRPLSHSTLKGFWLLTCCWL